MYSFSLMFLDNSNLDLNNETIVKHALLADLIRRTLIAQHVYDLYIYVYAYLFKTAYLPKRKIVRFPVSRVALFVFHLPGEKRAFVYFRLTERVSYADPHCSSNKLVSGLHLLLYCQSETSHLHRPDSYTSGFTFIFLFWFNARSNNVGEKAILNYTKFRNFCPLSEQYFELLILLYILINLSISFPEISKFYNAVHNLLQFTYIIVRSLEVHELSH